MFSKFNKHFKEFLELQYPSLFDEELDYFSLFIRNGSKVYDLLYSSKKYKQIVSNFSANIQSSGIYIYTDIHRERNSSIYIYIFVELFRSKYIIIFRFIDETKTVATLLIFQDIFNEYLFQFDAISSKNSRKTIVVITNRDNSDKLYKYISRASGDLFIDGTLLFSKNLIKCFYYLFVSHFAFGNKYDSSHQNVYFAIERLLFDWSYSDISDLVKDLSKDLRK